MNEQPYFHWDLLRQPIQPPNFGMGASFFDVNSILELRKEKSRDAARSRRGKENYEFYELAKLLPLPAAITSQLDKASIIRLSISYLKLRDFSGHGDPSWTRETSHHKSVKSSHTRRRNHPSIAPELFEAHQGTHILQSLDGFAFILGNDGRFLYISETVSIYLGLSQVEMAGSSIFDYVHQQDHPELAEHLGLGLPQALSTGVPSPGSSDEGSPSAQRCVSPSGQDSRGYAMNPNPKHGSDRSFCLRMKSTLTKRGVHVKSSGYRVVHILGQLRTQMSLGLGRKGGAPIIGLVGVAIALPPPTITELRLEHDTFITRMSPDFKLTYCEPIISEHMDLSPEDVTNRSLYDMAHAADLSSLRQAHVDVLGKGQVLTDYYRIMTRGGGYVWVQTCATTLLNGKNAEDQNILAINYILSGAEKSHAVMNLWQMCGTDNPTPTSSSALPGHAPDGSSRATDEKRLEDIGDHHQHHHHHHHIHTTLSSTRFGSTTSSSSSSGGIKEEQLKQRGNSAQSCSPSPRSLHTAGLHSGNGMGDPDNDVISDDDSLDTASPGGTGSGGLAGGDKNGGESGLMTSDCKNSRRKMERPRKRKREEMEAGGEAGGGGRGAESFPGSPVAANAGGGDRKKQRDMVPMSGDGGGSSNTGSRPHSRDLDTAAITNKSVSSPEDLSLKSSASSLPSSSAAAAAAAAATAVAVEATGSGHGMATSTNHNSAGGDSGVQQAASSSTQHHSTLSSPGLHASDRDTPGVSHWHAGTGSGVSAGGSGSGVCGSGVTPSAVKELEAVMNRHLPFLEPLPGHPDSNSRLHQSRVISTNGNLSMSLNNNNYPAHNHHHHHHHHQQQQQQHVAGAAAKKSTIQWVGSQSAAVSSTSASSSSASSTSSSSSSSSSSSAAAVADAMAASSFLRSLYESRESVIRSCNSSLVGGSGVGVGVGGGSGVGGVKGGVVCSSEAGQQRAGQVYEDMAGTLLTPPCAGDVFKDHPPAFSIPNIVISSSSSLSSSSSSASSSASQHHHLPHHHQHHPSSSSSPLTSSPSSNPSKQLPGYYHHPHHHHHHHSQLSRGGYPAGALSLTLPCGGGLAGDASYGMTPPSSVSPQDKLPSPFAAAAAALAYNESSSAALHGSCSGLGRASSSSSSSSAGIHPAPSPSSSSSQHQLKDGGVGLGCHSAVVAGGAVGVGVGMGVGVGVGVGHASSDYAASAKAAYYAMSALSGGHHPVGGHHPGYADVNHNTTGAAYDQCARPVIPWY